MKWILNIYKWILAQSSVNCNLSSTIFVKLQHDNVKSSFWIWSIRDPVSQVCMEEWISSGDRDLVAQLHTQWYIPPLTSHARLLAPLYSPQPPPPANFSPCVCQPWTSTKNPLNLRLQVWPKAFHCASYCWSCPRGKFWFRLFIPGSTLMASGCWIRTLPSSLPACIIIESTLPYLIYQQNIVKLPSTIHQCYDTFEMNQMKSSVSEWVAE